MIRTLLLFMSVRSTRLTARRRGPKGREKKWPLTYALGERPHSSGRPANFIVRTDTDVHRDNDTIRRNRPSPNPLRLRRCYNNNNAYGSTTAVSIGSQSREQHVELSRKKERDWVGECRAGELVRHIYICIYVLWKISNRYSCHVNGLETTTRSSRRESRAGRYRVCRCC